LKNEVFIDVIESVNILMSQKGTTLRNDVTGQIMMKTFLSGMPECRFGLNDKILLEKESANKAKTKDPKMGIAIDDCTFHQCVKLGKFESDRTITFVPPDGEFQLMSYRVTDNVDFPFRVKPIIRELGRTRIEVDLKVKSIFNSRLEASNVTINIPMPKNTAVARITTSSGKARYKAESGAIVWKIKRFPGGMEYGLSGEVELMASTMEKTWSRPPISMDFQVTMFTASGLSVRFLKIVEKSRYQTVKWVRYVTKAGTCEFRSTS
jgi:AP-2 complex subunit mu-1